jgi:hypothetical protein
VSNSRRGLLAAGLAVAVVGSMGTVWTLNAGAAETPEAEAPAVAVAPVDAAAPAVADAAADAVAPVDAEPAPVPPKLLPWGAKPKKIKRAKAGASSTAVAAAGAGAAPADTSGSLKPKAEYEPKGRGPINPAGTRMRASVVPPAPPSTVSSVMAAAAKADKPIYHYLVGTQLGETDGSWANLTIEKPRLAEGDFHTLAEISVESGGETPHAVEVGWTVDRGVNGDSDPHLFVYYWKDGVPICYNACGFTMYSKTVKPGDTLPVGESKRFGIQHSGGAWWIAYDSEWIGYFSDKNWESRFTKGSVTQWFGEVAASTLTPCTQMGNGKLATNGSAARIGSISMTNGPTVGFGLDPRLKFKADPENAGLPANPDLIEPIKDQLKPDGPWWSPWTGAMAKDTAGQDSTTTFRYGGPFYPKVNGEPVVKC